MGFSIDRSNHVEHIADKHFTVKCPHCNAISGLSLVSPPRYEYLERFSLNGQGSYIDVMHVTSLCF